MTLHGCRSWSWIPGLNAQIIHLQESSTFRVNGESKTIQYKFNGDGKLMIVTNRGGNLVGTLLMPVGQFR